MTDIDFDIKPRRPKLNLKPQPLPYEPTCQITCAVCAQRATIAVQWPGRICADCRADLPATKQRARQRFDAAAAAFESELQAWTDYQAALPADVLTKWDEVCATRTRLESKLSVALRGKYPVNIAEDERQHIIDACRKNLDAFLAKVARTRRAPQHPLYAVLAREAAYQQALHNANAETMAATIALQEIAAAMEDSPL